MLCWCFSSAEHLWVASTQLIERVFPLAWPDARDVPAFGCQFDTMNLRVAYNVLEVNKGCGASRFHANHGDASRCQPPDFLPPKIVLEGRDCAFNRGRIDLQ